MSMVCRLCGSTVAGVGWLERVNPKGEPGVWECRPFCGHKLSQEESVVRAVTVDPIVGHKTYRGEDGSARHEPLRQSEADALWRSIQDEKAKRAEAMPTEQDAVRAMWSAYQRLTELGWRDASYAPRDGRDLLFVEAGSTGIHRGHVDDPEPGLLPPRVWLHSHGDLWPSHPVLCRELSDDERR